MGLYENSHDPDLNTTIDGKPIFVWKKNIEAQSREGFQRILSLMKKNIPQTNISDFFPKDFNSNMDAWGWADQAANYLVNEYGGGILHLGTPGTLLLGRSLELPPNVTLTGSGPGGSCVKLANGANCDVVKSKGFDDLTGTGKITAEGAPSWFGLMGLRIDGNKANNSSGGGVKLYGARYRISDVHIEDAAGTGFYSEYSGRTYTNSWKDQEEARIDGLQVMGSGGDGAHFRGPHDTFIGEMECGRNGGYGYRSDDNLSPSLTWNGNVGYVAHLHTYANGRNSSPAADTGAYIGSVSNFDTLITDGDNPTFAANDCHVSYLKMFNAGGQRDGLINTGTNNSFDNIWANAWSGSVDRTMINSSGDDLHIGSLHLQGSGLPNNGMDIGGVNAMIGNAKVKGFSSAGKFGLRLTGSGHQIRGRITDCGTCVDYVSGHHNLLDLTMYSLSGQTPVTGIRPGVTDKFSIRAQRASGGDLNTGYRGITPAFAIDALVEHTITVTHGLLYTPNRYEIMARIDGATDRGFKCIVDLDDVTATTLVFKVRITEASSVGGANAKLCILAQLY